ncbi:capsule assembly Wzi family protein [Rhabdobacter roseus]
MPELLYSVSAGTVLATTSQTPFWLRTNQFGVVPLHSPAALLGGKIQANYPTKFGSWGYGVDANALLGQRQQLVVPEAYVKMQAWKIELWGGRQRQLVGWVGDSTLTSGSYIESGNAVPMPRVQIGFPEYVPLFKGLISFKGFLAHGWFDANPVVKNHYLHQKTLYVRIGKPTWPVRLYGGGNHNVQWGGKVLIRNQYTVRDELPQDWIDYWYVITGKRIPTFGFVDPDKYDAIDRGNRIGNHLGSLDIGMDIRLRQGTLRLYRQSVYDDGSLFYLANIVDGLHGLAWTSQAEKPGFFVKNILLEYLHTVSQGGSSFSLDGGPRGQDNYFNHAQYYGWVYKGNTIGTPFIPPTSQTQDGLPDSGTLNFSNNTRVRLWHLGISGGISWISYVLKLSYSQNLGTYGRPFPPQTNQFSSLLRLTFPFNTSRLGSLEGNISLASDVGSLYRPSTAIQLGIKKSGWFTNK